MSRSTCCTSWARPDGRRACRCCTATSTLIYGCARQVPAHARRRPVADLRAHLRPGDVRPVRRLGRGGDGGLRAAESVRQTAGTIAAHGITVWFSAPSVISLVRRRWGLGAGDLPTLRWSLFCGEPLLAHDAADWQAAAPNSIVRKPVRSDRADHLVQCASMGSRCLAGALCQRRGPDRLPPPWSAIPHRAFRRAVCHGRPDVSRLPRPRR